MFDLRMIAAAALTLALSVFALGNDFPIRTQLLEHALIDSALFFAAIYLLRSLFRLPLIAVIVWRRTRYARRAYAMNWRESLGDGLLRGFADRRRWSVGRLALLDRMFLIFAVYQTTLPRSGAILTGIGGIVGIFVLLLVYVYTGKFAFIVGDVPEGVRRSLPYIEL